MEQIDAGGDFPSRRAGPRVVLPRQGSAAAGAEQLADIVSWPDHVDEHLPESAEWSSLVTPMARPTFGTGALVLRSGSRRRASESSGLARRVLEGRPGTGMTSLLCLLSEALRGEGLGIPVPLLSSSPLGGGVFPSVSGRLVMLSIMAGMAQKCFFSSSTTLSVACAGSVLLVFMHLAICSLLAAPGPGWSASWPVWTSTRVALVVTMHRALCSLPWFAGPFLDPMVRTVPKPVEFPQVQSSPLLWRRGKSPLYSLQLIDKVFHVVHVSRVQAWRRQSSSTVLTWRRRSRSHSGVLRSWTWLLTCPLRCVYRCLSWSRQCRKGGVRRCSSWTRLPCPWCARQRSRQCRNRWSSHRCSSWTGFSCPQRQVPDGLDSAENCGVSAVGADFRTRLSTCPCWTSRGLIF